MKHYFPYTEAELENLKKCDEPIASLIERMGRIEREITPDLFTALTSSVVSQQISTKAAFTVFNRLKDLANSAADLTANLTANSAADVTANSAANSAPGAVAPQIINDLSVEEIKECGMSFRKAGYIKNIASSFSSNSSLSKNALSKLSDGEIIKVLTALSGIGVWTAEMMLIFCFCRKNVLSFGDLGIKRGLCRLYSLEEIDKKQTQFYHSLYSPNASIASLYLWELAGEKM